MSFDGQPLEEGMELLALVVKDSQQKGFFIRVVDPEVRGTSLLKHSFHLMLQEIQIMHASVLLPVKLSPCYCRPS